MAIKPCTEGKHSTTDLPPKVEKKKDVAAELQPVPSASQAETLGPAMPRTPIAMPTRERPTDGSSSSSSTAAAAAAPAVAATQPPPPPPESDDDDPSLAIPDGRMCRRRGCGVAYKAGTKRSADGGDAEKCVHHPGVPIFHEGSKGYSCCKRRVLEFDQFMKIEGCRTKPRHLFVGSGKKDKKAGGAAHSGESTDGGGEELLDNVRFDFYQSATSLTVSFFLKKIDKTRAIVTFTEQGIELDLPTTDAPVPKRYKKQVPLYGAIDPAKSKYSVLGTKLEVVLSKAVVSSWPVLRSDDRPTGEIFQVARAGKVER